MTTRPVLVLAPPGAGGAQFAAALAAVGDRPLVAWDEVADEPFGEGAVLRAWCREVLWSRERDWTCPPAHLDPSEEDRAAAARVLPLLAPGAVLHDVALPAVLPVLAEVLDEVEVVVAVRDLAATLPHLLDGPALPPAVGDDLVRTVTARLASLAASLDCTVVDLGGDADLRGLAATVLGVEDPGGDPVRLERKEAPAELEADPATERLLAAAATVAPATTVASAALRRACAEVEDDRAALDLHRGPRAAARRAVLQALLVGDGLDGTVLEVTRGPEDAAPWTAPSDARTRRAGDLAGMRQAFHRPPSSLAAVLLPDVLSWCDGDELRTVLEFALQIVDPGGVVAVGHSAADDEDRRRVGAPVLTEDDVATAAVDLAMVALPAREGNGVRLLAFAAGPEAVRERELRARVATLEDDLATRTEQRDSARERARELTATVAGMRDRVAQLEEKLNRVGEQRDRVEAQLEALRSRRAVRGALSVAEAVGRARRALPGQDDGDGTDGG